MYLLRPAHQCRPRGRGGGRALHSRKRRPYRLPAGLPDRRHRLRRPERPKQQSQSPAPKRPQLCAPRQSQYQAAHHVSGAEKAADVIEHVHNPPIDHVIDPPLAERFGRSWWAGIGLSLLGVLLLLYSLGGPALTGMGVWGTTIPYVWGFDLASYARWIGIRSEERSVGKGGVSMGKFWGLPVP